MRGTSIVFTLVLAALAPAGCNGTVSFDIAAGPNTFDVSTDSLGIPPELRVEAGGGSAVVASIPCDDSTPCLTAGSFVIDCNGGVCDPEPIPLSVEVGDGIDLESYTSQLGPVADRLQSVEFTSIRYEVDTNTLNVDLPPVTIFWGPIGAAAIESDGVRVLGTIPPIPAQSSGSGSVAIDAGGQQALSQYIIDVDRRLRLFARAPIDINPGQAFPDGSIRLAVTMQLHIVGDTKVF